MNAKRKNGSNRLNLVIIFWTVFVMCCIQSSEGRTITVALDGKGDFRTIQEAIASIPDSNQPEPVIIHIKPGRYVGPIMLPKEKSKVTFEGEGADRTFLTYTLNVYEVEEVQPMDKIRTPMPKNYRGTGVIILSDDFCARGITFENTSGDHGQAMALRLNGDRAVIEDCRLLGWQDTLLVSNGRHYFRNCYIEGRVDFIYGGATAVFDHCEIRSKDGGHITAASTPQEQPYGFVFLDCRLTGDATSWRKPWRENKEIPKADLGRPWRPYASVTYIRCEMGDHIMPEGWNNWGKVENEKTARYAEYASRSLSTKGPDGKMIPGKPIDVSKRCAWSRQLTEEEAAKYTLTEIFGGWNPTKQNAP